MRSHSGEDDRVAELLAAVAGDDRQAAADVADRLQWLVHATDDELQVLLDRLQRLLPDPSRPGGAGFNEKVLAATFQLLVQRAYSGGDRSWKRLSGSTRVAVIELYRRLGPSSGVRHLLLQWLAASRTRDDLVELAELLLTDPPRDATAAAVACGPLFQFRDYDPSVLFPRLFEALANPVLGPLVMDLANRVTREGLLAQHPGAVRAEQLAQLLGGLVQRLGVIEERPDSVAQDPRELANIVSQAVAMAVSLCDALGLIGDVSAIGKLNQVLELRHRRLRTEAAGALARLGDENGKQVLASLAAEPIARLRVLAYAGELGLEDLIDERFSTPAARAEAELACWLAQPTQLGFPPSRLELLDSQTMYWPGFDEPVECFLFEFAYEVHEGEYTGIGISGPLCHAFAADLADLPPSDIYAVFAGWHAEHEEIYELDAGQLTSAQQLEVSRLERRLRDEGCHSIQPVTLGVFFNERVLIARAVREGQTGVAAASRESFQWLPAQGSRRPLGPQEAYCLFKGRRLLRAFNP